MKLLTGLPTPKGLLGPAPAGLPGCPMDRVKDSITHLVDTLFLTMRELRGTRPHNRGPLLMKAVDLCRRLNRCGYQVIMEANGRLTGATRRTTEGPKVDPTMKVDPTREVDVEDIPLLHPFDCDCSTCAARRRKLWQAAPTGKAIELLEARLRNLRGIRG